MPQDLSPIDAAGFERLVAAAVLAPSSHNTQPWRFRHHEGRVQLWVDRTRALPANDPEDRELTISCGCALFNLRVAAAAAGWPVRVALWPDPDDPELLAEVGHEPGAPQAPAEAALFPALALRRTVRRRLDPPAAAEAALARLQAAAAAEGAWLQPVSDPALRHQVAELVAEGDALQWANPSWRRELAAWMHPRRRGDGLTVPGLALPLAQAVVRTFDIGEGVGAKDRALADASPLLLVLGCDGDIAPQWLFAGQALQRLLLVGCGLGLQASYLNQPVQVPSLRPKLQRLLGRTGFAQAVLRLGAVADPGPPAPRRALAEVIDVGDARDAGDDRLLRP